MHLRIYWWRKKIILISTIAIYTELYLEVMNVKLMRLIMIKKVNCNSNKSECKNYPTALYSITIITIKITID